MSKRLYLYLRYRDDLPDKCKHICLVSDDGEQSFYGQIEPSSDPKPAQTWIGAQQAASGDEGWVYRRMAAWAAHIVQLHNDLADVRGDDTDIYGITVVCDLTVLGVDDYWHIYNRLDDIQKIDAGVSFMDVETVMRIAASYGGTGSTDIELDTAAQKNGEPEAVVEAHIVRNKWLFATNYIKKLIKKGE